MLAYAGVCRAVVDSHSSASLASAVVPRRDNGGLYIYSVCVCVCVCVCVVYIYNVYIMYIEIYIHKL
jgi:hypothetical protein